MDTLPPQALRQRKVETKNYRILQDGIAPQSLEAATGVRKILEARHHLGIFASMPDCVKAERRAPSMGQADIWRRSHAGVAASHPQPHRFPLTIAAPP